MESDPFLLLQQTTNILEQAAGFFVRSNSKAAIKARELIDRTGPGHRPFHAEIHASLGELQKSIRPWKRTTALDHAQDGIKQALGSFEALIRAVNTAQGTDGPPEHAYAGLHSLRSMYDLDTKTSKRRPKPLGFRKYLCCPTVEMRMRLKNDIKACSQLLSRGPEADGSADILSELETIYERPVPSSMLDHATRVRDVLLRHWDCTCGEEHHDVKLAFTASPRRAAAALNDDLVGCYRLYWPVESSSEHTRSMPLLHLIRGPSTDASSTSNVRKKSRKRTVRFADTDGGEESAAESEITSVETFSTICDAVHLNSGECVVRADEETVGSFAVTSDLVSKSASPLLSLRALLVPGTPWTQKDMPPIQRVIMALALVYAYLHLSDTAWWPRHEVVPDFWFMNKASKHGLEAGLPFLSLNFCPANPSKTTTEGWINPVRPSLPALGKLLLEIWKGAQLNWGKELEAAVAECELDYVGKYWLCAINACLGKESALKEDGALHNTTHLRSVFVLKVVKSLQWLFEKCLRSSFDSVFPAPEPLTPSGPPQVSRTGSKSRTIPTRPSTKAIDAGNLLCLHDGSEQWEPYEQKNKEAANVWLAQLRSEVHPFVEPHAAPVKVAIIDTGVLFKGRIQMLYKGRVKEVRSFVREECGETGVLCPKGEDMDGHGTHAASVFLEIDPFSEVYVAKVFEKRGQKQGKALQEALQVGVARAIMHAVQVWKVQVISLSFGFDEQVSIIRHAILAAERSDVVVLAAASNNGGNRALSWPARLPQVISIYATNGYGNSYERNPTYSRHDDNFAVLGSCVKGWWNSGENVVRSGTSIATPIAAGLASLTIHFLRQHVASYAKRQECSDEELEEWCQRISTYAGMRRIFRRMVDPDTGDRDGYCYIQPWLLFNKRISKETICEQIIAELQQV